ncbi:MAG: acetylornithine/N-succinyldiaminopimelate aminotransferase [Sphingobacteriales bacterium]|jgi:acetylornithine/N-succinyldiaminopimelate aminotransferase
MAHFQHLARTSPHPFLLEIERAEGSFIFDVDGKGYLDFISGIGVSNFGHSHPAILDALKAQAEKHLHVMVYGEYSQKNPEAFATLLSQMCPTNLDTCYFLNSGAEAIDCAMKLVKRVTGRRRILSHQGGYHGNTHGPMSISWNRIKKEPFQPLLPGIDFLEPNNLDSLNQIDSTIAGVFLETIQGDAGVQAPTQQYMTALREKCTEHGVLLVLDEIQCGLGRTGKIHAFEHFSIVPDILVLGKGLGGGLPIGAVIASRAKLATFEDNPKLGHITTFGGHPLPCATGLAALKLLQETPLEEINKKGQFIRESLETLKPDWTIRQHGLFIGVDCTSEEEATAIILKAKENGLILFWFLSRPFGFRIAPPLNISWADLKLGISIFEKIL